MIILKKNKHLSNRVIYDKPDDFLRISGDNVVLNNIAYVDTKALKKSHWDANQFVFPSPRGLPNRQYAAGLLRFITIKNCFYFSKGDLQPVFGGDGRFSSIRIQDNLMHTASAHNISFNGLEAGVIKRNYTADGSPARVLLDSTRLGGGWKGGLYVLSMRGTTYRKINLSDPEYCEDKRGEAWNKNARYVADLDMDLFDYYVREITFADTNDFCDKVQNLALEMGTVVV